MRVPFDTSVKIASNIKRTAKEDDFYNNGVLRTHQEVKWPSVFGSTQVQNQSKVSKIDLNQKSSFVSRPYTNNTQAMNIYSSNNYEI